MTPTLQIDALAPARAQPSEQAADGLRIHSILAPLIDRSVHSSEIESALTDWTTYYYLSSQRCFFLRSIDHLIHGRILELGAECGSVTRFLAETGSQVIALEPVSERADAARLRCSGLSNVEILKTSDCSDAPAGPYDLILIRLMPGNEAFAAAWPRLRSLLSRTGRLVVVAPNDNPRGKTALTRKLRHAGFAHYEFANLLPDLDAASVVATPAAFKTSELNPLSFFDLRTLRHPRPGSIVSGHLVVAAPRETKGKAFPGLVYLYSLNRNAAFAKESVIERSRTGQLKIRRRSLAPQTEPVKNAMCRGDLRTESWLTGEAYDQGLSSILQQQDWTMEQIASWARPWVDFLRASAKRSAASRKHARRMILPPNYLDCTPFNLIVSKSGRLQPYDLEYAAIAPLELEYVVFRGLWGAFTRQSLCADPQPGTSTKVIHLALATMRLLGLAVSESRVTKFVDWESRFQHQVTGAAAWHAAYVLWQQPLSRQNPPAPQECFLSQLFWRRWEDNYQELHSSVIPGAISSERQTLLIPIPPLPRNIRSLRWDMTDRPGQFRLHQLDLLDAAGVLIWSSRNFTGSWAFTSLHQTKVIEPRRDVPLTFQLRGADPSVELALAAAQLDRLSGGGTLVVNFQYQAAIENESPRLVSLR